MTTAHSIRQDVLLSRMKACTENDLSQLVSIAGGASIQGRDICPRLIMQEFVKIDPATMTGKITFHGAMAVNLILENL